MCLGVNLRIKDNNNHL